MFLANITFWIYLYIVSITKGFCHLRMTFPHILLNTLVPYFQLIVSKDNYVISQTIKTCKSCECMQRMQHNNIFSKDVPIKKCFIIVIFFFQMAIIFRMQYKSSNNYNINVSFEHINLIKEVNETTYEIKEN